MVKERRIALATRQVRDMVAIPIPLVGRGRGDPRNILGRVFHCNDNELYTIAVKLGILKESIYFVSPCTNEGVSVNQAVTEKSILGWQKYVRRSCSGH